MNRIEDDIVPIKVAHLAEFVAKRKHISLREALAYIYVNPMHSELYDENAKWWYLSTPALFKEFEKSKKAEENGVDFRAFEFYVYCVERYSARTSQTALQVMALFNRYGADKYLIDNYDLLHTQDISYILNDITLYLEKRK